jgi:serine/threonine-protein kinase
MDFITRDDLIAAMNQWTLEKPRTLSEILVARGALDPADRMILDQMVDRHIARHGGDARQSLSSLDIGPTARSALDPIDDADVKESLRGLSQVESTQPFEPGQEQTASWSDRGGFPNERFQIIRLIDEGGLGRVFLARDGELNREVALKQMKEQAAESAQSRARFVLEAEITGNLEHPGVVPVYAKGECDGRPYYAMQFVRGENLKSAADQFHGDRKLADDPARQKAELQKLLRRFLTVCETMAYAHSRGVIHRDLKPKNILLGPFGQNLVVDWGLAKVVGRPEQEPPSDATLRPASQSGVEPTTAGTRMGTAAYMSPEQARGEVGRVNPASDIYCLGATLYYLLAGRPPFEGDDNVELMLKVERGQFRPSREVNPAIDRALDAICRKAMALNPEDRYQSPSALAEDLEHWLSDQPVAAYPEPVHTRAARWIRRHRQLAGSLGAVFFVALLAIAYHDWMISRAENKARGQLKITLGSLGYMLELCGVSLASLPNTERLRENVANNGLAVCRQLGESFPDDAGVQLGTSQVYRVIAGIQRIMGQFEGSRQASDRAIVILSQLSDSDPKDPEPRSWLVESLIDRGSLLYMHGRTPESERDFDLAIAEAERLKNNSHVDLYPRGKGMALINLSELYAGRGQAKQALSAAETAVELLGPLAQPETPLPRTPGDRWLLAIALLDRGSAKKLSGDKTAALRDLEEAERVAGRLSREMPDYDDAKFQLVRLWNLRSEWLADDPSRLGDALNTADRAIDALNALIKRSQSISFYPEQLALSRTTRARVRYLLGPASYDDALADCDAARKLAAGLIDAARNRTGKNPHYLSILGRAHEVESHVHRQKGEMEGWRSSLIAARDMLEQTLAIDDSRANDRDLLADIVKRLDEARGSNSKPASSSNR